MPERKYTPHQQKIIKNYYENLENIQNQKLGELISDLYLATTEKKRASLWKRVGTTLTRLKIHPKTVEYVVGKRDLETLTEIASEIF